MLKWLYMEIPVARLSASPQDELTETWLAFPFPPFIFPLVHRPIEFPLLSSPTIQLDY